jgi:hypothetical protein
MKTCYTVILGNYDTLRQPEVITPGWRYVCITDTPEICDGTVYEAWKPSDGFEKPYTFSSKWWKWQFWDFEEVDKSKHCIYHDGSFQVIGNLDDFTKPFELEPFATRPHPSRKQLYQEVEACKELGKISFEELKWFNDLCDSEYITAPVYENGILFFNTEGFMNIYEFDYDDVFNEIASNLYDINRDQLLLPIELTSRQKTPALIDREHAKQFFKWYPHTK